MGAAAVALFTSLIRVSFVDQPRLRRDCATWSGSHSPAPPSARQPTTEIILNTHSSQFRAGLGHPRERVAVARPSSLWVPTTSLASGDSRTNSRLLPNMLKSRAHGRPLRPLCAQPLSKVTPLLEIDPFSHIRMASQWCRLSQTRPRTTSRGICARTSCSPADRWCRGCPALLSARRPCRCQRFVFRSPTGVMIRSSSLVLSRTTILVVRRRGSRLGKFVTPTPWASQGRRIPLLGMLCRAALN